MTFSGDTVVTVIRAHLYLEHVIMQTLTEAFKVFDVVDFRRMSFPAKLDLGVALGIYPKPFGAMLGVGSASDRVDGRCLCSADLPDPLRQ